ncbi:MAG: phosphatidylglycerol lysyltransferase domain-containing protein [Candidatus Omnitrophota bacterium]
MPKNIKQIIPSSVCLACDVCCRYPERTTAFAPCFLSSEIAEIVPQQSVFDSIGKKKDNKTPPLPQGLGYRCSFFLPEKNSCRIYSQRPLDCQIYPFMVTYAADCASVILALDSHCPYFRGKESSPEVKTHADYLAALLESEEMINSIGENKNFIGDYQEGSIFLRKLGGLSKRLKLSDYGLTRISLKDKSLFDEYLRKTKRPISAFHFAAIYIWSQALNILWKEINGALSVFAGNDQDYFLFLPPLDTVFNEQAYQESLDILKALNQNSAAVPRIENAPEELSGQMRSLGLKTQSSSCEFIYDRQSLTQLKGEAFKSKRALANYFSKNYRYIFRPFQEADIFACLDLYRQWAGQKLSATPDEYFRFLIEDSYFAQKTALFNYRLLELEGWVVEIEGAIKGYTLGYPLNQDTFVILFETADTLFKGLPQFLFKESLNQLPAYRYINALSDSGLKNLKTVKESYRPIQKMPVFTAAL